MQVNLRMHLDILSILKVMVVVLTMMGEGDHLGACVCRDHSESTPAVYILSTRTSYLSPYQWLESSVSSEAFSERKRERSQGKKFYFMT